MCSQTLPHELLGMSLPGVLHLAALLRCETDCSLLLWRGSLAVFHLAVTCKRCTPVVPEELCSDVSPSSDA